MSIPIASPASSDRQHSLVQTGIPTILGSVLLFIAAIGVENRAGEFSPRWSVILFLITFLLLLSAPLGIRAAGAYGRGKLGTVGTVLTVLGLTLWSIGMVSILLVPANEWTQPFTPAGAMFSSLGMLITGIAVLRAKAWQGWHRFTPILVPVSYFLVVLPLQLLVIEPATGDISFYVLGVWYLTWALVGIAIRSGVPQ